MVTDFLWKKLIERAENCKLYNSFPAFSKSALDLLCVTIYTPKNTSAIAIPYCHPKLPIPIIIAAIVATIGCI